MQRGAQGARDEEEDTTKTFTSRVRQKVNPKGKVQFDELVPGKQAKGESTIDIQETLTAGREEATDALSKQRIPRDHKKQVEAYYKELAGESKP